MADPAAAVRPAIRMNGLALGNILRDDTFWYTTAAPIVFATGLENFQLVIPIQSDAHFVCASTMYTNSVEIGNVTATTAVSQLRVLNGGATIQLTDGGSQRFLSSANVPVNSIFGDARLPYIWPLTHLFRANSSINISITGTFGAAMTIRLIFAGFKIPRQNDLGI